MKIRKIRGRIINITSNSSKASSTDLNLRKRNFNTKHD